MTRIVAIHGAGFSSPVFKSLVPLLKSDADAIDLPGHGHNPDALQDTIDAMGKWVVDRTQSMGNIVLLGHSMGALVALEASAAPHVKALILLGGAARMPVHADLLETAQTDPVSAVALVLKWGIYREHPRQADIALALRKASVPEALYTDLQACNNYVLGQARADDVKKPVLVIAGTADKLVPPAASQDLCSRARGHYVEIPACGHMIMLEKPAETADQVNFFISSLIH